MESLVSYSTPEETMLGRKSLNFPPKVLYENRNCNQVDFSVLICGAINVDTKKRVNSVFKLDGPELRCKKLTCMPKKLSSFITAVTNSNLFILGWYSELQNLNVTVFKFCNKTKTWLCETKLVQNDIFIVCSFMNNLYVVYGPSNCFVYNLENKKLMELAKIKHIRYNAACTVFEGKIVVTGGQYKRNLQSVETYDHYENKWTYLPDMIEKRFCHASVSMGNKLFVIGGYDSTSNEIFDSSSRKLFLLRSYSKDISCSSV